MNGAPVDSGPAAEQHPAAADTTVYLGEDEEDDPGEARRCRVSSSGGEPPPRRESNLSPGVLQEQYDAAPIPEMLAVGRLVGLYLVANPVGALLQDPRPKTQPRPRLEWQYCRLLAPVAAVLGVIDVHGESHAKQFRV